MNDKNKTATNGDSGGAEIGLCINCEHALLDVKSKECSTCSTGDKMFKNFIKAIDKAESKLCATCSNNPKLPKKERTIGLDDGFPCKVCADDYYYSQIEHIVS